MNKLKLESKRNKSFFEVWGIPIVLGVLCVVMSLLTDSFATVDNVFNILRIIAILAIAGIGSTIVFISGGMDISIGSLMGMGGVMVVGLITQAGVPDVWAVIITMVVGALLGTATGSIITFVKLPPFIASLGIMQMVRGACFVYTGGYSIYGDSLSEGFKMLGRGYIGVVPMPVVIMVVLYAVFMIIMKKTTFGTQVYAMGSNVKASELFGINVKRNRILVYMIGGLMSTIAGIILASRLQSAQGSLAEGYEFDVMTGVVLGGTSIYGGKGKLERTMLGMLVIGVINNGLTLMNVSSFYQQIVSGLVLILALAFDRINSKD